MLQCHSNSLTAQNLFNATCSLLVLTFTAVPSDFYLVCKIIFDINNVVLCLHTIKLCCSLVYPFLASKCITLKILNYMFIEFIIYAPHIFEAHPNGLQSRHSLALLLYYARTSCKKTNCWKLFNDIHWCSMNIISYWPFTRKDLWWCTQQNGESVKSYEWAHSMEWTPKLENFLIISFLSLGSKVVEWTPQDWKKIKFISEFRIKRFGIDPPGSDIWWTFLKFYFCMYCPMMHANLP